jgi:membrane protease YdiL (CAAX protease family)
VLGVLCTFVLLMVQNSIEQGLVQPGKPFDPVSGPSHPIIEQLAESDWWPRLQVLFLAAVVAPIVEETMFRGVLYRHLREAFGRLGAVLSVMLSATLVSFIFAVIHPQGWPFVPTLMSLAIAFNIAREWRGTLVPCMVAHGIHNAVVTTFVIVAAGM